METQKQTCKPVSTRMSRTKKEFRGIMMQFANLCAERKTHGGETYSFIHYIGPIKKMQYKDNATRTRLSSRLFGPVVEQP